MILLLIRRTPSLPETILCGVDEPKPDGKPPSYGASIEYVKLVLLHNADFFCIGRQCHCVWLCLFYDSLGLLPVSLRPVGQLDLL
jgi:hypothetical protein